MGPISDTGLKHPFLIEIFPVSSQTKADSPVKLPQRSPVLLEALAMIIK